ncbi:MAG: hypothetical protein AB1515_04795 [Nitrospirota bacterium]
MLRLAPAFSGLIALAVFLLAHLGLVLRVELVLTWFYPIVWWSYIFMFDAVVWRRTGASLIWDNGRRFWLMAWWSAAIWLIFEVFNLRLENWWYHDIPAARWQRWPGTIIAFATVVPLLAVTERLLASFGLFDRLRTSTRSVTPGFLRNFQIAGGAMLLAALAVPRYAFPLVWGGAFFLIDPVNYRAGAPSLLREWVRGSPGRTFRLLLAGLIAGLLWELWNFWATARWSYTVPFVGEWKIFEMPILGFLGFPPFALEAFALYQFFCRPWGAGIWPPQAPPARRPAPWLAWVTAGVSAGFSVAALWAIEQHTILSFAPP